MTEPLPEITTDPPAGPNLELDEAFGEMDRAAQGKAESQFGNTIEAATPPDWKTAATLAAALLNRTRDLRVMVMLSIAQLNQHNLPGFAAGLATIRQHIETMWDHVHPQLDPEDDNDPLLRANALLQLAHPARVLRPLRDTPLATPARARAISWRDIAIVNGAIEAEPGRDKVSEPAIRGAFAGTDPARLAANRAAIASALADLAAIPTLFGEKSSPDQAPDFKDLPKILRDIERELVRYEPPPHEEPPAEPGDTIADPRPERPRHQPASLQSIAALHTREDALLALTLAAQYFRSNEPSSPLPMLIDRAIRLAPLPFLDVLRDLAPDGLLQAQTIAGTNPAAEAN